MENIFSFEDSILVGHPTQTLSTSEGAQGICQQVASNSLLQIDMHEKNSSDTIVRTEFTDLAGDNQVLIK